MLPLKKDIKLVRTLHQKKFRNEYKLFFVEGKKMVEEAMGSRITIETIYTTDESFAASHAGVYKVTAKEMAQMSALNTPASHLAVLRQPSYQFDATNNSLLLVLDGISDPGNMGTILRTAEWFGVNQIICTGDTVELYNPKVVQSSMGSLLRMPVFYCGMEEISALLKQSKRTVAGAEMQGISTFEYDFTKPTALVIGSESHGIRPEMKKLIQCSITIPNHGPADSLNAAMACGIILSAWRQKVK